jgi:hypothetical protein
MPKYRFPSAPKQPDRLWERGAAVQFTSDFNLLAACEKKWMKN